MTPIKTTAIYGLGALGMDALAGRQTEVDLFAGTVIAMGREYGIPTPVNERWEKILAAQNRAAAGE